MALQATTPGDLLHEAESLLEVKSINEGIDLLNRIGKNNTLSQ